MNSRADKISNPVGFYKKPSEVEQDENLSIKDKINLLNNWLDDIFQRQIADAENMQGPDDNQYPVAEVERLLHKYKILELGKQRRH